MKNVVITVLAVLVLAMGGYLVYDKIIDKDDKSKSKEEIKENIKGEEGYDESIQKERYEYTDELMENGNLVFFKDGEIVSEYKCNVKDCELSLFDSDTSIGEYTLNNKVLIASCDGKTCDFIDRYGGLNFIGNDGAYGQVLLYDIRTGTYKTYDNVTSVIWGYGDIQVLELKNNEYIIISGDGKVERKFNYDDYIFACYEGCRLSEYIYEKNIIIYKNNKKYGIQKIDNGEIILDAIYDSMRFVDNKYYIAEINGKYNLYNINNNKKATKKGYDQLFFLNEDLILTYKDQEISFINSKEEKLSDDTIPAENLYPILPKNPLGINAYIDENNICKISVCVGTDFDDAQCFDYTFNLNTHELIKLDGITY